MFQAVVMAVIMRQGCCRPHAGWMPSSCGEYGQQTLSSTAACLHSWRLGVKEGKKSEAGTSHHTVAAIS
jgi:hypothetical protein